MEFEGWLSGCLDSAGVDAEVFGGYISGTLNTLEGATDADIEEALLEVLQGCMVRCGSKSPNHVANIVLVNLVPL